MINMVYYNFGIVVLECGDYFFMVSWSSVINVKCKCLDLIVEVFGCVVCVWLGLWLVMVGKRGDYYDVLVVLVE